MEKKRVIVMNVAVVAMVLLLAVAAFLLSDMLPGRDITPTAGTLEEAGFEFTLDEPTP